MRIFWISLFTIFSVSMYGQAGITGGYFFQNAADWDTEVYGVNATENLLSNGYFAAIDYRLTPFENLRVELYPTLFAGRSLHTQTIEDQLDRSFSIHQAGFSLKTNIYLLSIQADCDCPTFSRQAGILEKGFFVQLAPGVAYSLLEAKEDRVLSDASDLNWSLSAGIGLDIGISEQFTITPTVNYTRLFGVEWKQLAVDLSEHFPPGTGEGNDRTEINQIQVGLRLGIDF